MRMKNVTSAIVITAAAIACASKLSAQNALPDEFDPVPRPYLQYKVTIGLTIESPFPIGNEHRTRYNLGGGAGINFEMHLLYPISLGFNYRLSRIFVKDRDINALILRTLGLTMRMFLDPRSDNQPYLLISLGGGNSRPSAPPPHNSGSSVFGFAELGAGYMMRASGHSWFRFELAYTGATQFGRQVIVFSHSGARTTSGSVDYDLSGILFRVEAGIVSW